MNRRNTVNIIFSAIVSVGFVLLGVFVFSSSYLRVFEAGGSLINSIKFYFCEIFGITHNTVPTVNSWSEVIEWDILLPSDFEAFKVSAVQFFELLADKENFIGYWSVVGDKSAVVAKVIAIALPCVLVFVFALKRLYANGNTKHNKDTLIVFVIIKNTEVCLVNHIFVAFYISGFSRFLNFVWEIGSIIEFKQICLIVIVNIWIRGSNVYPFDVWTDLLYFSDCFKA